MFRLEWNSIQRIDVRVRSHNYDWSFKGNSSILTLKEHICPILYKSVVNGELILLNFDDYDT